MLLKRRRVGPLLTAVRQEKISFRRYDPPYEEEMNLRSCNRKALVLEGR